MLSLGLNKITKLSSFGKSKLPIKIANKFECKLKYIFLRSIEECHYQHRNPPKDTLYEVFLPENLKNHQFCAGSVDDNVRTSFGDSGGPAFRRFAHFVCIYYAETTQK